MERYQDNKVVIFGGTSGMGRARSGDRSLASRVGISEEEAWK